MEKGISTAISELFSDLWGAIVGPIVFIVFYIIGIVNIPFDFVGNLFDRTTP